MIPAVPPSRSPARRLKTVVLLVGLLLSALIIVAWTQTWFAVTLLPDEFAVSGLDVAGDIAAGGLAGLGLAGLALVGALSIAGPVFRIILGILQASIGATVLLSTITALADPLAASESAVIEVTGLSGTDALVGLVEKIDTGFWPLAAAALGIAQVVLGVVIVVTGRRWPGSSRKFQPVRFEHEADDREEQAQTTDTIAEWDALSDGADPTAR